jgi:ABC-type multidrug transport system ATPase subunit
VDFADLGEFIGMPMRAYSSGMGARLRFAIAASTSHEILMIDEALATGDAEFRRRSEQRIIELRQDAGTVFLVSHSLGVVRKTCNRAIWLEQGKIIMDGPADDVVDAYEEMFDPEQEALERKQKRAKRRRKRSGMTKAERRAAREAKAEKATETTDADGPSRVATETTDADAPARVATETTDADAPARVATETTDADADGPAEPRAAEPSSSSVPAHQPTSERPT